jgi:hypothetical protein
MKSSSRSSACLAYVFGAVTALAVLLFGATAWACDDYDCLEYDGDPDTECCPGSYSCCPDGTCPDEFGSCGSTTTVDPNPLSSNTDPCNGCPFCCNGNQCSADPCGCEVSETACGDGCCPSDAAYCCPSGSGYECSTSSSCSPGSLVPVGKSIAVGVAAWGCEVGQQTGRLHTTWLVVQALLLIGALRFARWRSRRVGR